MKIARTVQEAVVGDRLWVHRQRSRGGNQMELAIVTKVARLYVTTDADPAHPRSGSQWDRDTGGGKSERGFTPDAKAMGYVEREIDYWRSAATKMAEQLRNLKYGYEMQHGHLQMLKDVGHAMGYAPPPDYSKPSQERG